VSRSRVYRKDGSLQRRAEGLAKHSDPSLLSLVSGVTQQSSASSGSNSTVTQKSYADYSMYEHREPERGGPATAGAMESPALAKMNAAQSEVFQYLQAGSTSTESFAPTDLQGMPPSTIASSSSSSSDGTPHDDGVSSVAGDSQHATDSATTSPASTRTSNHAGSYPPTQDYRTFKKPLYASSFVHGPGDEAEEEDDSRSESEEDDGNETDSNEEQEQLVHAPEVPVEAAPSRVPSAASRQSDPHAWRLKQQERELANHILQSPQPQKDIQFGAGPSVHMYPPIPMYSPHAYSAASPASMHATANPPTNWPPMSPMAHFPAPLAIGYAPHQSPEAAHAYPLAVRPPMGAPQGMLQQMPPPFPPPSVQPPHYQQHAPPSNQTRPTVVGYELLATELSGKPPHLKGIVPMYRKFEHLNHRVLLHLQDETSELEEELRHLDECIAQTSPRDAEGYVYPASRRNDARYGGELHFKRTELLGRIFQKLEQYNRALSAFSKLERELENAKEEDVKAYREWMDEHEPVDYTESQFIERDGDLVAITRKPASSPSSTAIGTTAPAPHYSAAVWFPLTLVLPLVAFAIVPSLLGRIVVILLGVAAGAKIVNEEPGLRGVMERREWGVAAFV
jgi:hypothetical protein